MDIGIEKGSKDSSFEFQKTTKYIFLVIFVVGLFFLLVMMRVQFKYSDKIVQPQDLQSPNVGLVFGAGLKAKGVPGLVLEDRVITAVKLFQENKVGRFILSGDNSSAGHNEVQAMKNLAMDQGLSEDVLLFDHAGLSTYDSCFHLKNEFNLRKVVLITQKYHLRRALYICNELGIEASGVAAQNSGYRSQWRFTFRELGASIQAWLDINLIK